MNTHLIIEFLSAKFSETEWTLIGNVDDWSAISASGQTTKKDDYISKELSDFIKSQEAAELAEANAKATEKAALLERLGITQDEAKLLLG